MSDHLHCDDCVDSYSERKALESELSRVKAELEETKKREDIVRDVSGNRLKLWLDVSKDRDRWRELAGKLLERMRLINGPESECVYAPCNGSGDEVPQCPNHTLIRETEAAYEKAVGGKDAI